jgi:predicted unusual protein kinase regulating ubiquinone biosynthesis (AarF/ABC1/UbiB family)
MLAQLSALQMQAPGMHPSLMRAQFEGAMGAPPEELFRQFDEVPFAAASLGQVHRAVTRAGEEVVVKIQYPAIRDAIENDFAVLRSVSRPAQMTGHIPAAVLDELEAGILAETDYRKEAENIEFLRRRLKPLAFVRTPRVYPRLSAQQVLTMSRVDGWHLREFLARKPSQKLRDKLGENLFDLFYFQILRVGAFHADPHAGNYLFDMEGNTGLVDFGCVKYLEPAFVSDLRELYLYPGPRDSDDFRSLLDKRYRRVGQNLSKSARRAFVEVAENFFRRVYPPEPEKDDQTFDFGKSPVVLEYTRETQKLFRGKALMPQYVFLARAEIGLYDMLHRLGARVHTSRIVRRHLEAPHHLRR